MGKAQTRDMALSTDVTANHRHLCYDSSSPSCLGRDPNPSDHDHGQQRVLEEEDVNHQEGDWSTAKVYNATIH